MNDVSKTVSFKVAPIIGRSLQQLRQKFAQSVGLPIQDALPMSQIEAALAAENMMYVVFSIRCDSPLRAPYNTSTPFMTAAKGNGSNE